jgi:hypothetical protein
MKNSIHNYSGIALLNGHKPYMDFNHIYHGIFFKRKVESIKHKA